jgi:hypothetical protein
MFTFDSIPYSIILIAQAICVWHVIKTNRDYKFIWMIVFLPLIGCGIYFFTQMLPGFKGASMPELEIPVLQKMKIGTFEKQLKACDSLDNRVALAELYAKYGREAEALNLIKDSVAGVHKDSPYLLYTYALILFKNNDFNKSLEVLDALDIASNSVHKRDKKVLRGRIYSHLGKALEAEEILKESCKGYDGEEARYWYAHQLMGNGKYDEAIQIADEGMEYFKESESLYRKQERPWYNGLKSIRSKSVDLKKSPKKP